MYQEKVALCGASSYEEKYYFNEDFMALPEQIQQELQIMCVLFTQDVGGVVILEFDDDGNLEFRVEANEADAMFDEIGSELRIKQIRRDKAELLESLELFYKVFFLEEEIPALDAELEDDSWEDLP